MAETNHTKAIGANVRAARERAGFGQEELAKLIGADASWLSRVESGERRLDSVRLFRLVEHLEVSADSLLRPSRSVAFARGESNADSNDPHVKWAIRTIEEMQAAQRLVRRYGL